MIRFKDMTAEQLHARLAHTGLTARAARRLQAAVMRDGRLPAALPEVSPRVLAAVGELTRVPALVLEERVVSPRDGFARYRFRGEGPEPFESVCIPLLHRPADAKVVVCVSSQSGCSLGCAFCATGRMGLLRNLAAWEIVDQVIRVRDDSDPPVRGVVFMGMGEPLLNYEAVMQAARVLCEPCGLAIAAKAITISTAGIVPAIRRFTQERQPYRLVVSLTSADPARRRALMPVEAAHPTPELIAALRDYHRAAGVRVTIAWTMMAGVNTSARDAQELAALLDGLPVKLDLIDVNDPSGRFRPPSDAERSAFRDALRARLPAPVARRYSGGADIAAACGMLAGERGGRGSA